MDTNETKELNDLTKQISNSVDGIVIHHILSNRKGKSKKEKLPHLIPNFENCLLKLCKQLTKCYDLKTHTPFRKYEKCETFEKLKTYYSQHQIVKAEISVRELCLTILALEYFSIKYDDKRFIYLLAKYRNLLPKNVIMQKEFKIF